MIHNALQYLQYHPNFFTWITGISILIFLLGIIVTPFLIAAIPDDYFDDRKYSAKKNRNPSIIAFLGRFVKNILGILLIIGGIVMLILPGQGLLTLVVGVLLLDYPGKYHFERKLLFYPPLLKMINWVRIKRKKKPFILS